MKHFFNKPQLSPSRPAVLLAIAMTTLPLPLLAQDVRTQALEQQLQQLEASLRTVRNELDQVKAEFAREAQKLMEIEEKSGSMEKRQALEAQRVAKIEEAAGSVEKISSNRNHMLFFRGGYARSDDLRSGVSIQSGGIGGAGGQADRDAWYIGAGFDFNLTNDACGLLPRMSVMSELMFEYKEFGSRVAATPFLPRGLA